jgi:polyhydroxyalkanoate synthesis repressor PhaR
MTTSRIIKKYPNRRLYDTEINAYITLDDIKKLVIEHVIFQVIDARTNKDLTQSTLLQIITEQEASSTPLFTTTVLQDFIRFYHEKSQNTFSQYLEQALALFIHQKEFFQNQWLAYQTLLTNPSLLQQAVKKEDSASVNKKKAKK